MSSEELYNKHRPKLIKHLVGQDEVKNILNAKIKSNSIPHAIMLSGPSGCGKTTIARIIARKLQCGTRDLKEINAASNRGIDEMRQIERQMYSAPIDGPCRVWILDEGHQLTSDAQTSLLKVLEDGPSHSYFIICTTNPNKVKDTVRNRCTQLVVHTLDDKQMKSLLSSIIESEKADVSKEVVDKIVKHSGGKPRNALVYLDAVLQLETKEKQLEAILQSEVERIGFELGRLLINPKTQWHEVSKFLKEFKGAPEEVRHVILAYATTCLLGGGKVASRAYIIINAFRDPFFETAAAGKACLAAACFEVVTQP